MIIRNDQVDVQTDKEGRLWHVQIRQMHFVPCCRVNLSLTVAGRFVHAIAGSRDVAGRVSATDVPVSRDAVVDSATQWDERG